jgi:hypothetical protein
MSDKDHDTVTTQKGQAGTMTTKQLQESIKTIMASLGWSVPHLAEVIYTATHDEHQHCDDELKRFREKIKKELNRETTKPEKLEQYLRVISQDREFEKIDLIIPNYIPDPDMSDDMLKGLKGISKKITMQLKNEYDE